MENNLILSGRAVGAFVGRSTSNRSKASLSEPYIIHGFNTSRTFDRIVHTRTFVLQTQIPVRTVAPYQDRRSPVSNKLHFISSIR